MIIDELRRSVNHEEIDYLLLTSQLKRYKRPRDKITQLLQSGALIRIKKGLYIFGERYARGPYIIETLANLIYGPSCISLEYALAFYGMTPERVEVITSVTNKRDKTFKTPVGLFTYRYLNIKKYPVGMTQILIDDTHSVFFATPEKALADKIMLESPGLNFSKESHIAQYLYEDLRLYPKKITALSIKRLTEIALVYSNRNINLLVDFLKERANE